MNLTNVFLKSAPVKERLSFGVNENVFLRSVSTEIRKDKDGNKIKKSCYLTFSKIDPESDEKKIVAEYDLPHNVIHAIYTILPVR